MRRDHAAACGADQPHAAWAPEYQGCAGQRRPTRDAVRRQPLYFTAEKAVGARIWLTMLPTIWPSRSLSARALIQSGSRHECCPFLLALGERFPRQKVGQLLLDSPISVVKNPAWPDAVLFPDLQRGRSNRLSSAGSRPGTQR